MTGSARFEVDVSPLGINLIMASQIILSRDVLRAHILPFLLLRDLVRLDSALVKGELRRAYADALKDLILADSTRLNLMTCRWFWKYQIHLKDISIAWNVTPTNSAVVADYLNTFGMKAEWVTFERSHLKTEQLTLVVDALARSSNISRISAYDCNVAPKQTFLPLLVNLPNLRDVNIAVDTQTDKAWLFTASEANSQLKKIELTAMCHMSDYVLCNMAPLWPCLQELVVTQAHMVTDKSLEALATHCPELQSVTLCHCTLKDGITDQGVAGFCRYLNNLRTLRITGLEVRLGSPSILSVARFLPLISTLELDLAEESTPMVMTGWQQGFRALLPAGQALTTLRLTWSAAMVVVLSNTLALPDSLTALTVTGQLPVGLLDHAQLAALPAAFARQVRGLRYLNLHLDGDSANATVYALGTHLNHLEHVRLRNCMDLADSVLLHFIEHNQQLQQLCIPDAQGLTDDVLVALCARGAVLRSLELRGSSWITDDGVGALAAACPALQTLDLSSASQLTDDAVRALANHSRRLQQLSVQGTEYLSIAQLNHLGQRCRRLQRLRVHRKCLDLRSAEAIEADHQMVQLVVERC